MNDLSQPARRVPAYGAQAAQAARRACAIAATAIGLFAAGASGQSDGERGVITSVRGCTMSYQVWRAPGTGAGPVAIVAHGTLRRGSFMAGWADTMAAAGVTAITVDLCATPTGVGRHADDGADMVALRRALGARGAIYVGVSAGGLAALVAASLDPEGTRGVLLLDPVNAGEGRSAAGKVIAPVAALVARSQVCNAWRNIDAALESLADSTIVRISRASHCDFEWPTDRFCRVVCLDTRGQERREGAQRRIRDIGIEFVRAIAEGTDDALARWRGDIGPE